MNQHYRQNDTGIERRPLYRSRKGIIFGVCRGIAEHLNISVFWFRVGVVAVALLTGVGFIPLTIVYVAAALLMKLEPVLPPETEDDLDFYNTYASSRGSAVRRLKRTYDTLNRRIQRMEDIVTAREYDWERRLND